MKRARLLSLFVRGTKEDKNNLVVSDARLIFAAQYCPWGKLKDEPKQQTNKKTMNDKNNLEEAILNRLDEIKRLTLLQSKKVLTVDDVAALYGYSKSYVYKMACEGKIPYYKPDGKGIFFNRDELDSFFLTNRFNAIGEGAQMCSRAR